MKNKGHDKSYAFRRAGFAHIILIVVVLVVAALALTFVILPFFGYSLFEYPNTNPDPGFSNSRPPETIVCTMDAKLCPDGSYVSRSGPKCEFAACPTTKIPTTSTPTPVSQQRRF